MAIANRVQVYPAPVPDALEAPVTLATLLGVLRHGRGLTVAHMAEKLEVSRAAVNRFENGASTSDKMLLGYMETLALTSAELDSLTDRITVSLTATLYDKRTDPLERAVVADRLKRVLDDSYTERLRELISGPSGTRTRAPGPQGQVPLTAIEGNPNPSVKSHQATFNI